MEKKHFKLLIAGTGSVAAMKIPNLINSILDLNRSNEFNFELRLIVTDHAKHFFGVNDLPQVVREQEMFDDRSEWDIWRKRGDPVLHIDLGKWADAMLIAPLDANTLAKMAHGICDNLITCTTRAWDLKKPLLFCPAMNTRMFEHPITSQQIATLKSWGHIEIPPISKTLMCGDTGMGAMAEVDTIVETVKSLVSKQKRYFY